MSQESSSNVISPCSSSQADLAPPEFVGENTQQPYGLMTFLDLPPEIRLMIYSHLTTTTGVVTTFAHHTIGQNVSKSTLTLLHLNRLIRSEVEDFFYASQEFTFRSIPALRNFISDIGERRAALIRKVRIDSWLSRRFAGDFDEGVRKSLGVLKSVKKVVIEDPSVLRKWGKRTAGDRAIAAAFLQTINSWHEGDGFSLGPSGYLILGTWEQFLGGKAYLNAKGRRRAWGRGCELVFVVEGVEGYDSVVEAERKEEGSLWLDQRSRCKDFVELPDLDTVRAKMAEHTCEDARVEAAKNKAREKRKRRQRQNRD